LSTAVYAKSLRLTAAARQTKTLGEIVNLMQIDASKIEGFITQLHVIWDGKKIRRGLVFVCLCVLFFFFFCWCCLILTHNPLF
jgi:hypothetical protein